jgi:HAD superfamily hydrolase (TIGR01484 family)
VQPCTGMRYHALAADYDGTLAHHGRIDADTYAALERLRDSGRKIVMVTGRELDELLEILDRPELFDRIVAENGALLYEPATKEVRMACAPPPPAFAEELARRGVAPLSAGRAIVATWTPHENAVLDVIREQGLELQVIFNKGAVMVLPSGVNKATGLACALAELELSPHNVAGVGDAENDHALLQSCECGAAVANALDALKERADLVLSGDHGAGVRELIEHLIADDLAIGVPALTRHHILLGRPVDDDRDVLIDPYSANIMVCGTSGSGKSTLTQGLLERLHAGGYQFAIVDPEGDYGALDIAVALGAPAREPLVSEAIDVLRKPSANVAINLLGIAVEHRPPFYVQLLAGLTELRALTGRPHWLVVDEAHHLMPEAWRPAAEVEQRPHGTLYVTVHPGSVAKPVLETIDTIIAIGGRPDETIRELCAAAGHAPPPLAAGGERLPAGQALYWKVGAPRALRVVTEPPKGERKRHSRKYMEGNVGSDRAFYFRGPDAKLNLKAHNLQLFLHLADGVDDDTWSYHLGRGDYSTWFRTEMKDAELADEVRAIERDGAASPVDTRAAVRAAVEARYTVPADKPSGIVDSGPQAQRGT